MTEPTASVHAGQDRPFWSILIPTYEPPVAYFQKMLAGVLQQDRGPAQMHIEVVDDCSTDTDVPALVKAAAGDRIAVTRNPQKLGLAGNWNACIERSRGAWVHLLHQDDVVYPGFYAVLESMIRRFPDAGAALTRHSTIDDNDRELYLSPEESQVAGVLSEWHTRLAPWQRLRCPAVVVRRDVYRQLGLFRSDLPFCLDWEMWTRIAARFPFAYSPQVLAAHREHQTSETSRLSKGAAVVSDCAKTYSLLRRGLPADAIPSADVEFAARFEAYAPFFLRNLYARAQHHELRTILAEIDRFPFSRAFRRQIRIWSWKMRVKTVRHWLRASGLSHLL